MLYFQCPCLCNLSPLFIPDTADLLFLSIFLAQSCPEICQFYYSVRGTRFAHHLPLSTLRISGPIFISFGFIFVHLLLIYWDNVKNSFCLPLQIHSPTCSFLSAEAHLYRLHQHGSWPSDFWLILAQWGDMARLEEGRAVGWVIYFLGFPLARLLWAHYVLWLKRNALLKVSCSTWLCLLLGSRNFLSAQECL